MIIISFLSQNLNAKNDKRSTKNVNLKQTKKQNKQKTTRTHRH